MIKKIYLIILLVPLIFSCSRDEEQSRFHRKTDTVSFEGGLTGVDDGCNYILNTPQVPNLQNLINKQSLYPSQKEWDMDFYLLILSEAIHDYINGLCLEEERWEYITQLTLDNSEDIFLDELLTQYPGLDVHIDQYLTNNYGFTYQQIRQQAFAGFVYVPNITIVNRRTMDPTLPAFIGAAVEYDVDGVSDFAPFRLECEQPVQDYLIARVEDNTSHYDPAPNLECLYNPIIVVNWQLDPDEINAQQKHGSVFLGDVTDFVGVPYDTIFPNPPASRAAGCDTNCNETYELDKYNLAGLRYERWGKSEVYISYITERSYPPASGTPINHECDYIDRISKSDVGKTHGGNGYYLHDFDQVQSLPWNMWNLSFYGNCDIYPTGGFFLGVTYERDWFNSHKRVSWNNHNGKILYTDISAKYAHEYWQVIFVEESDWCDQDTKRYGPKGFSQVYGKW